MTDTQQQRQVIATVDDMFFAAKIRATAAAIGRDVIIVKSPEQLTTKLEAGTESLVLIDLNAAHFDPLELVKTLRSGTAFGDVTIVGFLSHVQVELKQRAEQAGCDLVMARSAFSLRLPQILAGELDGR